MQETVSVIMTTYDPGNGSRTPLAINTLKGLLENLYYPNLHWIVADDGSNRETHISPLESVLQGTSYDISIVDRKGVGASKNQALQKAFEISPLVLMLEDDWMLVNKLDLAPYIKLLEDETIGMVRFGYLGGGMTATYEGDALVSYWRLNRGSGVYIYSGQVSLRHKRFYDVCGLHDEHTSPGEEELEFCKRFNATEHAPDVVWPAAFPCQFNSGIFLNIGMNDSLNALGPGA